MNKFIPRAVIYLGLFCLLIGISFFPNVALGIGPPPPPPPVTHTDRFVCAPDGQTPVVILKSYESGVDYNLSVCAPGPFLNATACYNQDDHVYTCALSSSDYDSQDNECKSVDFDYTPVVASSCSGIDKFTCNAGYTYSSGTCWSAWTPLASTVCLGVSFTQTRTDGYGDIQTQTAVGTKTSSIWTPPEDTVCNGRIFQQVGDCGDLKVTKSVGTRSCGWREVNPSF